MWGQGTPKTDANPVGLLSSVGTVNTQSSVFPAFDGVSLRTGVDSMLPLYSSKRGPTFWVGEVLSSEEENGLHGQPQTHPQVPFRTELEAFSPHP